MSRIVVVSNRVPTPSPRPQTAGGLAVALQDALATQEALWFGWSGTTHHGATTQVTTAPKPRRQRLGNVTYATIDLDPADHAGFYQGFANGMLWPLLHGLSNLGTYRRADHEAYDRVNRHFALALAPLLRRRDIVWVHDYQLFGVGRHLRDLGVTAPIGFFLHVPFPPAEVFMTLPRAEGIIHDLAAYDLIGTQIARDAANLCATMADLGQASVVRAFPIGIDPRIIATAAGRANRGAPWHSLVNSLGGRQLTLGVDRLDYTKGLPQRFHGYAQFLRRYPEHRSRTTFLQIAPVSRRDVTSYRGLRRELDELVGRINGEHADVDWTPLRYITRALPRTALAGLYRVARVGLVTPLRDGMNLVAKEYVAAQDPADPGVLVLSRFAGAAEELTEAILVNPRDPDDIADALNQALAMPLAERRARWESMMAGLRANTAASWSGEFIAALSAAAAARGDQAAASADMVEPDIQHARGVRQPAGGK